MKISLVLAAVVAIAVCGSARAGDAPITIEHAWLRATPRNAPVAGGYATITNHGTAPDTLLAASLPIAAEGQIHSMTMKDGVMEMRRLGDGLSVAPGTTVTLEPGGDHLMFLKPSAQLKEGETIRGSLTFRNAGTIAVTFAVGGMAAKSAPGTRPTSSMKGMDMKGIDMKGMDHMRMH